MSVKELFKLDGRVALITGGSLIFFGPSSFVLAEATVPDSND